MSDERNDDRIWSRRWVMHGAAGIALLGGIAGTGLFRWASAHDDDDDDDDRGRSGNRGRGSRDDDKDDGDKRRGKDDDRGHGRHDDDDDDDDDRRPARPARPDDVGEHVVEILDEEFVPATITINVGEWITWANLDDDEHTATGRDFDTGELDEGESADIQFTTPGVYPYVCQFHAEMTGEVIVLGDLATPAASPEPPATPVAGGVRVAVSIVDFAFDPPLLDVPAGTTVVWTNNGQAPHTVTAEIVDSDTLRTGDSFQFTFTTPGAFDYVCAFHPQMTGRVNVT